VSGAAVHTVAVATGDPADRIDGMVFALTRRELAATDAYEVDYERIEVTLAFGLRASLYVGRTLQHPRR